MKINKIHVDSVLATLVVGYADGERYTTALDGHDEGDADEWAEDRGIEDYDDLYTHLQAYAYVVELEEGTHGPAFATLDEAAAFIEEQLGRDAADTERRRVSGEEDVQYAHKKYAKEGSVMEGITDMLANMMHAGVPFDMLQNALRIAHDHYNAEVAGL